MEFEPEERTELADRVADDLHDAGIEFCTPVVLEEICWRLSRADWTGIMDVSTDFAAWVSEHEINEEAHLPFRRTATPAALQRYRTDRWLRFAPSDQDTFA